jgi:hypothetical protein
MCLSMDDKHMYTLCARHCIYLTKHKLSDHVELRGYVCQIYVRTCTLVTSSSQK